VLAVRRQLLLESRIRPRRVLAHPLPAPPYPARRHHAKQKAQDTCQQRVAEFQQRKRTEEAARRAEEQRRADRRAATEERERQREQRAKDDAQRRDKEARERAERRQREQEEARAKEREEAWGLVKKAYEAKNELAAAVETARDPVGAVEGKIRSELEETHATPDEEGLNDYRFAQKGAKKLNSLSIRSNPFAKVASGAALKEVGRQHTTTSRGLDRLGEQIQDFTPGDLRSISNPFASSASATRQSLPAQGDTPTPQTADVDTPAASASPQRVDAVEEVPPAPGASARPVPGVNPWASDVFETTPASRTSHGTAPPSRTYVDPDIMTEFVIPAGHVLYRDPVTRKLRVVRRSTLEQIPSSSDRPEAGTDGCGTTGLGIITPECEKKRQKNPFAAGRGAQ
jgi:hypothetical protein